MDLNDENFGIEVKKKLLDMRMQQLELAEKLGISKAYLSEILSGKKESLDMKRKILSIIDEECESECVSNGR